VEAAYTDLVNDKAGVGAGPVEVGRLNFCDKLRHGKSLFFLYGDTKRQIQVKVQANVRNKKIDDK